VLIRQANVDGSTRQAIPIRIPAAMATIRFTAEPVTIGGVTIRAEQIVLISPAAANRDPPRYDDPAVLDLRRDAGSHLAFGHGVHYGIGARLARAETEIAPQQPAAAGSGRLRGPGGGRRGVRARAGGCVPSGAVRPGGGSRGRRARPGPGLVTAGGSRRQGAARRSGARPSGGAGRPSRLRCGLRPASLPWWRRTAAIAAVPGGRGRGGGGRGGP
jgi:hypothetical protein